MKRRALGFKLLLFLLAGAIINIAVAWGLVWQTPPVRQSGYYLSPHLPPWWYSLWEQRGRVFLIGSKNTHADTNHQYDPDRFPHWSRWQGSFEHENRMWLEQATGWPSLSVESMIGFAGSSWQPEIWHGFLLETHTTPTRNRVLGYFPIWPGFAINTIFYAGILWLLFAAPSTIRRWHRIKRGQCASCGYSLRENVSEKCPECGATLKQKAETQKAKME
jgi:predicted RNA-binding Zn-ribbon protein involved in translation (DUF1610 family)